MVLGWRCQRHIFVPQKHKYIYQINVLPDLLFLVFQNQQGFNFSMSQSKGFFQRKPGSNDFLRSALLLLDERALIISMLYCLSVFCLFTTILTALISLSIYAFNHDTSLGLLLLGLLRREESSPLLEGPPSSALKNVKVFGIA